MILDDNRDNLMTLELYSPTQEQADLLSAAFRSGPDRVYHTLLSALLGSKDAKE